MRYRVDTPRRINRRPPPKSSRLAKPTERRRFTARNSILAHCLAPTPTNPANAHYCRPEKSHGVRLRSHSGRHETGSKPGGCGIDEYHARRKVERIGLNDQDVGHRPWYDPEIEHAPEPDRIPRRAAVHRIWLHTAPGGGQVSRGTGWSNIANVRR